MKTTIYFLLTTVLLLSCSKQQRTVNKLSGRWEVKKAAITGVGELNTEQIFDFDQCRIRKNNYCDFTLTDLNNNETTYGSYLLDENGNTVTFLFTEGFQTQVQTYTIEKVNCRKLILVNQTPEQGSFERFDLRSL